MGLNLADLSVPCNVRTLPVSRLYIARTLCCFLCLSILLAILLLSPVLLWIYILKTNLRLFFFKHIIWSNYILANNTIVFVFVFLRLSWDVLSQIYTIYLYTPKLGIPQDIQNCMPDLIASEVVEKLQKFLSVFDLLWKWYGYFFSLKVQYYFKSL